MGNCLKTKLKDSVNANLPVLGKLTFVVNPGTLNFAITAPVGSVVLFDNATDTIKVGVDVITSGWAFLTDQSGSRFNGTITKKTKFTIENLYGVTRFNENSGNTCEIEFANLVSALEFGSVKWIVMTNNIVSKDAIHVSSIKNPSGILKFQYEAGNLVGALSDFADFTSTAWINVKNNPEISGNVNALIPLKQLESINLIRTNASGTVEDLVAGQFDAQEGSTARRSGSLLIQGTSSDVTFNGGEFASVTATFGANSVTVTGGGVTRTYDGNSWS